MNDSIHDLLHNRVLWLHTDWIMYKQLFENLDENKKRALSRAPLFFDNLRHVLYFHTVLTVARLLDPVSQGSHENLVLESLPVWLERDPNMDSEKIRILNSKLEHLRTELSGVATRFRPIRNTVVAHNDLSVAVGGTRHVLPDSDSINAVLRHIADFMNFCNEAAGRGWHLYSSQVHIGGIDDLINALSSSSGLAENDAGTAAPPGMQCDDGGFRR